MKETLIITGWGHFDYGCAAAAALRRWKDADVCGMSTRRLPEFLSEVSGYKTIAILGVSLAGNPELLRKALEKLTARGTHIAWISAMPAPEGVLPENCSNIEIFVKDDYLTCVAADYCGEPCDDLLEDGAVEL